MSKRKSRPKKEGVIGNSRTNNILWKPINGSARNLFINNRKKDVMKKGELLCGMCGETFFSNDLLYDHKMIAHPKMMGRSGVKPPYVICRICDQRVDNSNDARAVHLKEHEMKDVVALGKGLYKSP
ncbi:hypothetical protein N9Z15_05500 [Akkermansiaceae bacterium]|nr:hypothetical protein [Akkermansiaceae bacterium]